MDDYQKERAKQMYVYYTGIPVEAIISVQYNHFSGMSVHVSLDKLGRFISVGPVSCDKSTYSDNFALKALVSAFNEKLSFHSPRPVSMPLTMEDVAKLC